MFTVEARDGLRDALLADADGDDRIDAAAVTGSGALDREDRWSDIDLALRLSPEADRDAVLRDWTARMYEGHRAVHHLDVVSGPALYRVFLLASTLQVDLAFWPAGEFGATGPAFRLMFGTANERPPTPAPVVAHIAGWGWLCGLHARSSIARGRRWQAEYMINEERRRVLALACLRHDLPPEHGRGFDLLPQAVTDRLLPALVRSLEITELRRAFAVVNEALLDEIDCADPGLAARLRGPIAELTISAGQPAVSQQRRSGGRRR